MLDMFVFSKKQTISRACTSNSRLARPASDTRTIVVSLAMATISLSTMMKVLLKWGRIMKKMAGLVKDVPFIMKMALQLQSRLKGKLENLIELL